MRLTTEEKRILKEILLIRIRILIPRCLKYVFRNGKASWKSAKKPVINSELTPTANFLTSADKTPNGGYSNLELMKTSLRFRLSRKPHGRSIRAEQKRKRSGNFTLDTSSNQGQHQSTSHTTQHTRKQNKMHFALCKRTLNPARHNLKDTSQQNRHEYDAGNASVVMGRIN